jgi:hypothetical protein
MLLAMASDRTSRMTSTRTFPKLSALLRSQLARVEIVHDGPLILAPSQVTLRTGEIVDHVYIVEANSFIGLWGWDPNRRYVRIQDVVAIRDCPSRLPARFAGKLYIAGESSMGGVVFSALLKDGSRVPFSMGNAVDFPSWPDGLDPSDVIEVVHHPSQAALRDRAPGRPIRSAEYSWCLYS